MAPWEQLMAAYRHPRDEHTHTHDICCANMSKEIQEFRKVWTSPDFGATSHLVFLVTISRNVRPRTGHHFMFRKSPAGSLFPNFLGPLDLQTSFFWGRIGYMGFSRDHLFFWGLVPQKRSKPVAKTCQDSHFSGLSIEHTF